MLLGAALLLTGCGRKGPLEPPPDASVPDAQGNVQQVKPQGPLAAPKGGFILDPVLK